MKLQKQFVATLLVLSLLFPFLSGCVSRTQINSQPPGADVYINNSLVGQTPYLHSDNKIVGTSSQVRLEMAGYEPFNTIMTRDEKFEVGPCIGGVFLLIPFLWVMGYEPVRTYVLKPAGGAAH